MKIQKEERIKDKKEKRENKQKKKKKTRCQACENRRKKTKESKNFEKHQKTRKNLLPDKIRSSRKTKTTKKRRIARSFPPFYSNDSLIS